uniref:B3 domain-containing protein n=1 Tax=Solanum tuberosum TaxID=4113 RepID=M1DVP5_SOLTU
MWPIGVTKSQKHICFEYGWKKFIEDNILELGDFFIFDYDGTRTFDFKLLGRNGCVKKGVGVKCKSATAGKRNDPLDKFTTDILRSGRATTPKNPYFITKISSDRRNQLYIPTDVVRDYQLELPSSMTIHDSSGREFEAKLKIWQDGRIWLIGNTLGLVFEIIFTQKRPDAARHVAPLIGHAMCQAVCQPCRILCF